LSRRGLLFRAKSRKRSSDFILGTFSNREAYKKLTFSAKKDEMLRMFISQEGFTDGFGFEGRGNPEDRGKDPPAAAVNRKRFSPSAKPLIDNHEVLITLLNYFIYFYAFLVAFHGFFPLLISLPVLTQLDNAPQELAPQAFAK
jgi:hypothetical protein